LKKHIIKYKRVSDYLKSSIAIILAGGQGERLYPLTQYRAKPAVPFGGSYRIVDFTLSNLVNSNLHRIYLLTQYKSHSIDRHISLGWNIFSSEFGQFIYTLPPQLPTRSGWYEGTANAVYQNINTIKEDNPLYVIILAGDHIYKMDYRHMLRFHLRKKADVTIAAWEIELKRASQMGILQVNSEQQIIGFEEKPSEPKPLPQNPQRALASMGIYIFNTDALISAVMEDAQQKTKHDFGYSILPPLVHKARVFAYNFKESSDPNPKYWRDIGTLDSYWEANMDLLQPDSSIDLFDSQWPIRSYCPHFPPAKLIFNSQGNREISRMVSQCLIAAGCQLIDCKVERSILSPTVTIESGSEVKDSILMDGVIVQKGCQIKKAIIDKWSLISKNTILGYDLVKDRKLFKVTRGKVVVIPRGSIV